MLEVPREWVQDDFIDSFKESRAVQAVACIFFWGVNPNCEQFMPNQFFGEFS